MPKTTKKVQKMSKKAVAKPSKKMVAGKSAMSFLKKVAKYKK